jgi:AbrB family looped-hinge helix DNA binding protein
MQTTRLSTKGQIILPKPIRESKAWKPGMEFIVEERPEGVLLRPASLFPRTTLDQVVGCLKWKGKPKKLTSKEIQKAIDSEVKRRHDLGRY